jgi:threonine synthase
MTDATRSLATGQRSLGDPAVAFPLWPPLTGGCPRTSTEELAYPVDVTYSYDRADKALFGRSRDEPCPPGRGIGRWAPLLPPLRAPGLGEGGTPLFGLGDGVFLKDESRNPTWSHKDRLNRCTVSAALGAGAPGVIVASSGNHAASAAAYAARAGLRCVVLGSGGAPPAVASFMDAYGAVVLPVPREASWPLTRLLTERLGYHPVSNVTATHTGHPFGVEGYKTIAYEIFRDLGGSVPAAVFLPTGYGELLSGVGKGFAELRRLGLAPVVPRLFGCEPAAGGPLAAALRSGLPAARVEVRETAAYGISCAVGGYRAARAVRESGGEALLLTDEEMRAARRELAGAGLWVELSAAAGLVGLRQRGSRHGPFDGPVVCVSTSSGFKDTAVRTEPVEFIDPAWESVAARLDAAGILT